MVAKKVLFVCIHNSGRSQMAEAFLNEFGGEELIAQSAGFEPGTLNPLVVEAMKDENIDISGNKTDSVFDFFKNGKLFNYVVTVCDESSAEKCPIFPGVTSRIHMSFEDPMGLEGSDEYKILKIKEIRDKIKKEIKQFVDLIKSGELEENMPQNWKIDSKWAE